MREPVITRTNGSAAAHAARDAQAHAAGRGVCKDPAGGSASRVTPCGDPGSLTATCFARCRRAARRALRRLGRLVLAAAALVVVLLAAQALGCRTETSADSLGLRLRFFRRRAFGLRLRIVFAAHELDLRDLGAVALAEADPEQPRVAAGPRREARRQRVEQLGDDLAILQVPHDQTARGQDVAVLLAAGEAALGDRDQPLD